jgi:hypothetical protein
LVTWNIPAVINRTCFDCKTFCEKCPNPATSASPSVQYTLAPMCAATIDAKPNPEPSSITAFPSHHLNGAAASSSSSAAAAAVVVFVVVVVAVGFVGGGGVSSGCLATAPAAPERATYRARSSALSHTAAPVPAP